MDAIALWNRSSSRRLEVAVFGMACPHCRGTVETVLEDLDGVGSVEVSLDERRAWVDAAPRVGVEALVEAIQAVGYEARPASGT